MLGVDDSLLDDFEKLGATRSIPREDVANLVVEVCMWRVCMRVASVCG